MDDTDKNETITSLLHTIALIREAAGVNEKPMLSELPDAIRKLREERDEARRSYCWASAGGEEHKAHNIAQGNHWDCFKEDTND